jgi:chromosome segregation ATPase
MTTQHDFSSKAKARIEKWDAQIAEAEGRMKEAQADAKVELQKQIEEMRKARGQAQEKLNELQAASDEAWKEMREGSVDAWKRIEDAFDKASDRFAKQD